MSDEVELASRVVQELEPAVQDFAATVVGSPAHELGELLADKVRYRRYLSQLKILKKAKDAAEEAGLSPSAVPWRTLVPLLEYGAYEDDEDMLDRWAGLLANAATKTSRAHVAYPEILRQLEPIEAAMLDAMYEGLAESFEDSSGVLPLEGFDPGWFARRLGIDRADFPAAAANLVRLELANRTGRNDRPAMLHAVTHTVLSTAIQLTAFGAAFVEACRPPARHDPRVSEMRLVDWRTE